MKSKVLLSTVAFTIIFSCANKSKDPLILYSELTQDSKPNTITKLEKKKNWKLLFDGTTNKGWHGYNLIGFPDCWTIEEGTLTMNSVGAQEDQDIITNVKYKNFALSVDFKLSKGANSGILYQVSENLKYKFPYETGPEFQIIDHENWSDPLEDWQICGANYAMYPPMVRPYKTLGEWNNALLVVDGNNVTQLLNGEIVVKYTKYSDDWEKRRNSGKWIDYPDYGKFDEGCISLQNHGTKVWYCNIKIKEL
ncbi:MAG: DUF1080 domain-containing protein [Bacteroidia bacterium]|nr:DUF1080 domain-containing protein [Bacteroidia bacterium]